MRHVLLAIALTTAMLTGTTYGQHPPAPYVVLRAPVTPYHHHHARHLDAPVTPVRPVYRQPYAYGWFGAPPRRHWSRHFGYHRNFTQWSAR